MVHLGLQRTAASRLAELNDDNRDENDRIANNT